MVAVDVRRTSPSAPRSARRRKKGETVSLVEDAYRNSIDLLRRARQPEGFVASPTFDHYAAVWARDAAVACLGASVSGENDLLGGVESTLDTLARLMTPRGQVPDAYWPGRGYWDWGEAGTTDSTAWFVIALVHHVDSTGRADIARRLWPDVCRALTWLGYQDVTGTGLVDSPAGGDWMDSSLNRSGRVFHVNVLAQWAARGAGDLGRRLGLDPVPAGPSVEAIEALFWPTQGADLADLHVDAGYDGRADVWFPHGLAARSYAALATPGRRHYLAGVSYGRFTDRCDVLAHCLGIASGLISGGRALDVLSFLAETGCDVPFPSRTWPEPFSPDDQGGLFDAHADGLQDPRWRNPPGSYHNGAVWPYVGGAHVVAEASAGRNARAASLLESLAAANREGDPPWGFHEWIHVPSGRPAGARDQTWNAGAYAWAYHRVSG